ncbi:hypothetical protein [Kytococcus sedentarius]|uniref:hypothetical protein n=1 Tax=Kytococcus sedentarius TaxID=1276 RepID=UPI0035BBE33B
MAASQSIWRLPWRPVTGDWIKLMWEFQWGTVGDNPITEFISLLLFIPLVVLVVLWLLEMAVELVLWPFFVAGRAIARGVG